MLDQGRGAEEFVERLETAAPPAEPERKGGWWATEWETAKFLNLRDKDGRIDVQQAFDLVNPKLSKRRSPRRIVEADIERLGPRKFRVWCCKPDAAGNRRPRMEDRKA